MVRRLLVVLLCFSCGFSILASGQCLAQETTSDKKAAKPTVVKPDANPIVADPAVDNPSTDPPSATKPKLKDQEPAKSTEKAEPKVITPSKTPKVTAKQEPKVSEEPKDADQEAAQKQSLLSEALLPASTKFWLSIPDADQLETQFDSTQFGLLAKDPAIKPFIDSLRDQAKEILNDQNVRLGLEVDDLSGVHSGEICIAGVLPDLDGKQLVKGSHGLVLLVDVSGTEEEARELQKKINAELVKRGGKVEPDKKILGGIAITKTTINNPKRIRKSQSNYQAILNGWMLVSDNETIFRDILRRLAKPQEIKPAETLASKASFLSVMKQTDLKEFDAHIRWFVDPFGYIQLAQALEDEERGNRQQRDDWSKILKDQGFSAFQGIGGNISIATGEHEILHRTFTYAPRNQNVKNPKRIFELFDFNGNTKPLEPANWVPTDSSAYVVGNWQFSNALSSVGGIYDAFLEEEGAFKRTLNDFKVDPDMQLDVVKLVGLIDNRMTMVSATERPIDENSERVVLGFPIKGEPMFVFDSLVRATRGEVINLGGIKVIEVDSAAMNDEDIDETFNLPGEEPIEDDEPEKRTFELFAKRYFAVHKGNLLVANNKNYLKRLLAQKTTKLAQSPDYIQIKESIGKLTIDDNVRWRQFGRMDRTLETNYEMIRRGEMGNSQTVLARLANQIFAKRAAEKAAAEGKKLDENAVRKQRLDGSKLPADYAKSIAPYFGPMGWVMEIDDDGWRITGCVIKKKEMTEVVQKTDETDENKSEQR